MSLIRVLLPAVFLLVGCAGAHADTAAGPAAPSGPAAAAGTGEPVPGPTNVVLYVSNQSFADDPVGIRVELAGRVVVDDSFRVESQHTWVEYALSVPAGTHRVRLTSSTGVEAVHELVVPAEQTRWAVVEYWHYPDGTPRSFTFRVSDHPVAFD